MSHFMDHEPAPTPTDGKPVWDMVIEDMRERDQVGRERYGTPLQIHNGRRALVDAYQEALDLVVYLRQEIEERRALEQHAEQMAGELHALRLENATMREDVAGIVDREVKAVALDYHELRKAALAVLPLLVGWFEGAASWPAIEALQAAVGDSVPADRQLWSQVTHAEGGCPAGEGGAR